MRQFFRGHRAEPADAPVEMATQQAPGEQITPSSAAARELFISYSRRDRAIVETIARHLRQAGLSVWYDSALEGGQHWWDAILSHIRQADAFLTMLSPESLSSAPCLMELRYAVALGKPLLPVRISDAVDPSAMIPEALRPIQMFNLAHVVEIPQQGAEGWEGLESAVWRVCGTTAPYPPQPLPERPAAPIGSLAILRELVTAPWLSSETQAAAALQLKAHLKDEETANTARSLLGAFAQRNDLAPWVADDVAETLRARPIVDPNFSRDPSAPFILTAETLERLRERTGVHPMSARDNDRHLSRLPNGVFGYAVPWIINSDSTGVVGGTGVERLSLGDKPGGTLVMEVHKAASGVIYIVGYTDRRHATLLEQPQGAMKLEIELFFSPYEEFDAPVAIPVERIMLSQNRSVDRAYVNDMEVYVAQP